jgi:peptide/nickel transport system substrate-binding protein
LTYTFTLREGLRFHDGSALTISDVEFTLNEAKRLGALGFSQIQKIERAGDRKIQVVLNNPDSDFLPYLTVGIVPKNNSDREKNPIGSGPFTIANYLPQQQLTLVKNPYYWQQDLPKLDRVTVLFAADNNALYSGLEGGNLNGAMVSGDVAVKLDKTRFDVVSSYSNSVQLLALNNNVKPLDDVRVRQALNYAIDVQGIIDTAFYGLGEPSGSPLIPGLSLYYNEALRDPYPVDLAKARALLAEAGYGNGFNLEIKVASNYTMHVDTAQVIVNQLARIGVRVSIRLVDWAAWLSEVYMGRNYEATIISLDAPTVSPQGFLSRYVSTSPSNFLNYNNAHYDRIYNGILRETTEAERIRLYKEAQRIISDDAAGVYIQDIFAFKVFSGGFRGIVNYPLYVFDFSTIYRN